MSKRKSKIVPKISAINYIKVLQQLLKSSKEMDKTIDLLEATLDKQDQAIRKLESWAEIADSDEPPPFDNNDDNDSLVPVSPSGQEIEEQI